MHTLPKLLILEVLAASFTLVKSHKPFINIGQSCPTVTPSSNFNADSYLGLWYNLANSPFIWMDSNNTCAWAHYNLVQGETDPNDDYLRVINSEISAKTEKRTYAVGEAYVTSTPGQLSVAFFTMPKQNADNYIVLDTDNIGYSYVWTCHDFEKNGVVGNMPVLWIMNRDFNYNSKYIGKQIGNAMEILKKAGYDTKALEVNMGVTEQHGCGYGEQNLFGMKSQVESWSFDEVLQGSGDSVNISCSVNVGIGFD